MVGGSRGFKTRHGSHLAISHSCRHQQLPGEAERFDAGNKPNCYITRILGQFFEILHACPEAVMGLGVPRPSVRLQGDPAGPRVAGVMGSIFDRTEKLDRYDRSRAVVTRDPGGYIFKRGSPSCGTQRVKIFDSKGSPFAHGSGVFAKRLMKEILLMPVQMNADSRIRCSWKTS